MRERTHGQIGIDLPVSGEQGAGRGVRPSRRQGARAAPRPAVRPAGGGAPRAPAARRPADPAAPPCAARPCPGRARRCDAVVWRTRALPAAAAGRWMPAARWSASVGGCARCGGCARLRRSGGWCGRRRWPGLRVGGGAAAGAAVGGAAAPGLAPGHARARRGDRLRRLLAGLALVLVAAAVVVGLGRIADLAAQSRAAEAPAVSHRSARSARPARSTRSARSPWAGSAQARSPSRSPLPARCGMSPIASRPARPVRERAAMVDRIVAANSLTSMRVAPGEVLRVPSEATGRAWMMTLRAGSEARDNPRQRCGGDAPVRATRHNDGAHRLPQTPHLVVTLVLFDYRWGSLHRPGEGVRCCAMSVLSALGLPRDRLPRGRRRAGHPPSPLLRRLRASVHHGRGGRARRRQAQWRHRAVQP